MNSRVLDFLNEGEFVGYGGAEMILGTDWLSSMEENSVSPMSSDFGEVLNSPKLLEDAKEETVTMEEATVGGGSQAGSDKEDGWTRLDALRRYKLKREKRSYRKKIRYHCRKKIAAGRPRSGGRFVKVADRFECDDFINL